MEYKGKKIMEFIPSTFDSYRQKYIDGLNSFIDNKKINSGDERRNFISPEMYVQNPEKYRTEFIKMIGLDNLDIETSKPVEREFIGSDEISDIFPE